MFSYSHYTYIQSKTSAITRMDRKDLVLFNALCGLKIY